MADSSTMHEGQSQKNEIPLGPLPIDLKMDFGDKSRVMEVLNRAYAGSVVDKHVATSAIREFQGILDKLYNQPPAWEMVTMRREEVDNMREIIKYQDQKLRVVTDRVNKMSHGNMPRYPLPTDKDRIDTKRRLELADKFNEIYDVEWKTAYTELLVNMRWKDVECIYALMRVIRNACDLCINLADDQMDKLLAGMEDTMIDPLNGNGGKFKQMYNKSSGVYSEGMKVAEKYAIDYRIERAEASVPSVIQLFMETKLRAIIEPTHIRREFKKYVEKCVELVWLMTTLDPPMRIYWQQQTERVNTDFFDFYNRAGDFVNQTVWPSVFIHNTGQLVYKGQMLTM